MDGTILIADDDRAVRTVLTQALTRAGCRVHATGNLGQLMRWVEEGRGDLVVTDVMMPDGDGLTLVPAILGARPGLPVIVISARNSIVTAIRAAEAAAFDYLPKPFDVPELLAKVQAGLSRRHPAPGGAVPAERQGSGAPADAAALLIGHAPAMQALFRSVARVVNESMPVIVAGEPGTGRTTLARALHTLGVRQRRPLVTLGPADRPEGLAQRLAEARGGTLILEDPASWPEPVQVQIAALIEAAGADAPRLVATTGPDPQAAAAEGRLRPELYHRLAGQVLTVPPLRARAGDLPALAQAALDRLGGPARSLSPEAIDALRAHPFPGNLRELDNVLHRVALNAAGPVAGAADIAAALDPAAAPAQPPGRFSEMVEAHLQAYFDLHGDQLPAPGLHERILREIERPLIQIALDACNGNQLRCAELLGINRNTLRKKVSALNIEVTRRRRLM